MVVNTHASSGGTSPLLGLEDYRILGEELERTANARFNGPGDVMGAPFGSMVFGKFVHAHNRVVYTDNYAI